MKRIILSGLLLVSLTTTLIAQQKPTANKAIAKQSVTAPTTSLPIPEKVTAAEGITEYKLANGLKVLLFPDPSKQTITVNITYLVGSRHEGYGETLVRTHGFQGD
jgi:zinc protease